MLDAITQAVVDVLDAIWSGWMWVAAPLAAAGVALAVVEHFKRRGELQRRATPGAQRKGPGEAGAAGNRKIDGLVSSLDGNLGERDEQAVKRLRGKLMRAGYFDKSAIARFFAIRVAAALGFSVAAFFALTHFAPSLSSFSLAQFVVGALGLGYFAPLLALDRLVGRRQAEYRQGFPDVMDLMIVCVQAGLSMEAGLARIASELKIGYPRLAANLHMATLEVRGGKPLSKAIESMAQRLGIEEAISFATLLQQSEEIGASLSQSLRAYSDDMRNKRMMKAEEKAHALPAKLVIPLTVFIFPTLLVVIALPGAIGVARTSF